MKKVIWQRHHITYEPELIVWVRRSEHWAITQLQRFKELSPGAKRALRHIARTKPEVRK
jgi:hypothetical protein